MAAERTRCAKQGEVHRQPVVQRPLVPGTTQWVSSGVWHWPEEVIVKQYCWAPHCCTLRPPALLQPILLNMVLTCIHEVNAAFLPVDCSPVQRDMTFYCLTAGVPALFERLGCSRMRVDTTTRGMGRRACR